MEPKCRLHLVAWLYMAVGVVAVIESAVGLFAPLTDSLVVLFVLSENLNLAIFLLPVGIGLRRHSDICRKLGLVASLLWLPAIAAAGVIFLVALVSSEVSPTNWGISYGWEASEDLSTGDAIAKTLTFLAVCLPVYVWQIRVLWSEETKSLTQPSGETAQM